MKHLVNLELGPETAGTDEAARHLSPATAFRRRGSGRMTALSGLLLAGTAAVSGLPHTALAQQTANNPYTRDVLVQIFVTAADKLLKEDPELNSRFNKATILTLNNQARSFAREFGAQFDKFATPAQQFYQLRREGLRISALADAAVRDKTGAQASSFFDSLFLSNREISQAEWLLKLIQTALPSPPSVDLVEPGVAIDLPGRMKAGQSWPLITRDWDRNAVTWETPEFKSSWGLGRTGAQYAYALGITGKGVNVGVFDSGVLSGHLEFQGKNGQGVNRVQTVTAEGAYSFNNPVYSFESNKKYTVTGVNREGGSFYIPGEYDPRINDNHGTEMSGVLTANRNGTGGHGFAFDANVFVANTGGTDSNRYQGVDSLDYGQFKAAYDALGVRKVIAVNNSWGQDSQIDAENTFGKVKDTPEKQVADLTSAYRPFWDALHGYHINGLKDFDDGWKGKLQPAHKTWLDAMADAALSYKYIQVVSAGNDSTDANPVTNASLPYFRPETEPYWAAVTGFDETNGQVYTRCGVARWWCVMGVSGLPSVTSDGGYTANANGTSASAPAVTGSLALVAQRFPYMTPTQAFSVLLTTSRVQVESDPGKDVEARAYGPRTNFYVVPTRDDADPETSRYPNKLGGWGLPDLGKAMRGPGQFFGRFEVTLPGDVADVWSNDISDAAIKERAKEDAGEHEAWLRTLKAKGWENGLPADASHDDRFAYELGTGRERARQARPKEGGLVKDGLGALTLTGRNTYSGSTVVRGGLLNVDGMLTASRAVVEPGGTLGGSGAVFGLSAEGKGAVVSPGHSIGTLHVGEGGLSFGSGMTYLVEAESGSNAGVIGVSDRIVVDGPARIDGGHVEVRAHPVDRTAWQPDTRYTILTAAGGIMRGGSSNGFEDVTVDLAFLAPSLNYTQTGVGLTLARESFVPAAETPNDIAVAKALDKPRAAPVVNPPVAAPALAAPVVNPPVEAPASAAPVVSPQVEASAPAAPGVSPPVEAPAPAAPVVNPPVAAPASAAPVVNPPVAVPAPVVPVVSPPMIDPPVASPMTVPVSPVTNTLQLALLNLSKAEASLPWAQLAGEIHADVAGQALEGGRLVRDAVLDRMRERPAEADRVWLKALGGFGESDGDSNAAGVRREIAGFVIGADKAIDDAWLLGVTAGFADTSLRTDSRGSAEIDAYHLGLYGEGRFGDLSVRLGGTFGFLDASTTRSVSFPGFRDRLKADSDARQAQLFGEVGYALSWDGGTLEPFAGLAWTHVDADGFEERGGEAALKAGARSYDRGQSTLGMRVSAELRLETATVTPSLTLGWRHTYGDVTPARGLRFADATSGGSFAVSGVPSNRDSLLVEAGFDARVSGDLSLGLGYRGDLGGEARDHAFSAKLGLRF